MKGNKLPEFTSIDSRAECVGYFRARLSEGGALSSALASRLETLDAFYTFMPRRPPSTDFWRGGLKETARKAAGPNSRLEEVAADDEALAEVIARLSDAADSVAIFEKQGARATDPFLKRLTCAVRTLGDEVLITASRSRLTDAKQLLMCVREAKSLPRTLGFLAAPGSDVVDAVEASLSVQPGTVRKLAGAASLIFVTAYDGESYLFGVTAAVRNRLALLERVGSSA